MLKRRSDPKKKYDMLKCVGSGTYGKVYKALRKADSKIVAIKVINIRKMDRAGIDSILNEIRILSSISNPYIVEYYEAFIDLSETHFHIVMEFVGGGDLANAIKISQRDKIRINEKQIWSYMIQILKGIVDLHKLNIIHRDIKPANIFLTEDYKRIKIGDMNVSKVLKQDLTKTQIGTPYYLAPEIWNKKAYNFKADVFSLGALVFELAALKHPYEARSTSELHYKIKHSKIPKLPSHYSDDLNYIVYKCLTKEQVVRPTAEQLLNSKIIQKKITELKLESFIEETVANGSLLDTIILPRRLANLNKKLPKKGMVRSQSEKKYASLDESKEIIKKDLKNFESFKKSRVNDLIAKSNARNSVNNSSSKKQGSKEDSLNVKKLYKDQFSRKSSKNLISYNSSKDGLKRNSSKKALSRNNSSNNLIKRKPSREKLGLVPKKVTPRYNSANKNNKYKNLSIDKKRKPVQQNLIPKKRTPTSKNVPPLPIARKSTKSSKEIPVSAKYYSHRNVRLKSERNNPPMKMPKTPPGAFSKKKSVVRVEEKEKKMRRESSQKSIKNSRYQSPRAQQYADYIKKMAEKDRQRARNYSSNKKPGLKRCKSYNKDFVF